MTPRWPISGAPALASANTGVAMGARGTAISAEAANLVLLGDNVTKVSEVIMVSRRTIQGTNYDIFVGRDTRLAQST